MTTSSLHTGMSKLDIFCSCYADQGAVYHGRDMDYKKSVSLADQNFLRHMILLKITRNLIKNFNEVDACRSRNYLLSKVEKRQNYASVKISETL